MLLLHSIFWSGRSSAQTPSPWQAVNVAIGGDSLPRILWTHPDGRMVLWTLHTPSSAYYNQQGPYAGWTARAVAVGPNGKSVIMWTSTSGQMRLNLISTSGQLLEASRDFGPFSDGAGLDWRATSLAVDALNQPRVVFKRADGLTSIWQVDGALNLLSQSSFGPYSGWSPDKIGFDGANTARLNWNNSDGRTDLWSLDANMVRTNIVSYGPYAGQSPYTLSVAQDGTGWLGWKFTDQRVDLWHLDGAGNRVDIKSYGPYTGWQSRGIAVYPSPGDRVRALWQYQNGGIHLWNLSATGDRDSTPIDIYNFPATNVTATPGISTTGTPQIRVSADLGDGSTTFTAYRSNSSGGPFNRIGSFGTVNKLGIHYPTYSDTNVVSGNTYYYRATAYRSGVESGTDTTVSAVAPVAPTPQPTPMSPATVLFNEEFDSSSHWTGSGGPYEGTNWQQYLPMNVNGSSYQAYPFIQGDTEWGNVPVALTEPSSNGTVTFMRMKLSTYNPDSSYRGTASFGSELQSKAKFQPQSVGQALEFETRLRLPNFRTGLVAASYLYNQAVTSVITDDEIDCEYVGGGGTSSAPATLSPNDQIQLTAWNNWERTLNGADTHREWYNESPRVHFSSSTTRTGVDRTQWHYLKIRWSHLASGYRTDWYIKQNVNDAYQQIGTESSVQPDMSLAIHLNLWAPGDTVFPQAKDPSLVAVTSSAANTDYLMDVDSYRVSSFNLNGTSTITSGLVTQSGSPSPSVPSLYQPADPVFAASALPKAPTTPRPSAPSS